MCASRLLARWTRRGQPADCDATRKTEKDHREEVYAGRTSLRLSINDSLVMSRRCHLSGYIEAGDHLCVSHAEVKTLQPTYDRIPGAFFGS